MTKPSLIHRSRMLPAVPCHQPAPCRWRPGRGGETVAILPLLRDELSFAHEMLGWQDKTQLAVRMRTRQLR